MTPGQTFRVYAIEPAAAALTASVLVNVYGARSNAAFMHAEARDCLALLLVLLGASMAMWAGIFFISTTDFGKWLAQKGAAENVNRAFIVTIITYLLSSLGAIVAAYVAESHLYLHLICEALFIWSMVAVFPMLNNTRSLLKLYGLFLSQPKVVQSLRAAGNS